ncbi:hypothetical protein [Candidatus Tisiphia endosymbiont of Hybos culiciformis]|uniref:hypothetical protein n=1 Tax=Candidatus Tisiphia endosymbiont of Hybos culiciformis TaxID=3139331 RepID=UPI003CCA9D97
MANEEKEAIKFKELEKQIQQLKKRVQPGIDMHSAASFKTGLVYNLLLKIEPLLHKKAKPLLNKTEPVFKFIYQYFYLLLFFCLVMFIVTTSRIYDRAELVSVAKNYMLSEQARSMIVVGMISMIIIVARRYSFIVNIYNFLEASVTSFIVIYSFTFAIALIVHSLMIKFNIIDIQNVQETNIMYILIAIFLATMFIFNPVYLIIKRHMQLYYRKWIHYQPSLLLVATIFCMLICISATIWSERYFVYPEKGNEIIKIYAAIWLQVKFLLPIFIIHAIGLLISEYYIDKKRKEIYGE